MDTEHKPVAHVQVYDTAQHRFTLLQKAMPRAYSRMRAVLWETSAILLDRETCFIYNFETETWLERENYKANKTSFAFVIDNATLYIAGGCKEDKDNRWTFTGEVLRVSVRDVIEDKRGSGWTHHATLPRAAEIYVYSPVAISAPRI